MSNEYNETAAIQKAFDGPKPSLGRIVHISRRGKDPLAAIIVAVMPDGLHINATAFNSDEATLRFYSSVRQGKPDEPNTWSWPSRV